MPERGAASDRELGRKQLVQEDSSHFELETSWRVLLEELQDEEEVTQGALERVKAEGLSATEEVQELERLMGEIHGLRASWVDRTRVFLKRPVEGQLAEVGKRLGMEDETTKTLEFRELKKRLVHLDTRVSKAARVSQSERDRLITRIAKGSKRSSKEVVKNLLSGQERDPRMDESTVLERDPLVYVEAKEVLLEMGRVGWAAFQTELNKNEREEYRRFLVDCFWIGRNLVLDARIEEFVELIELIPHDGHILVPSQMEVLFEIALPQLVKAFCAQTDPETGEAFQDLFSKHGRRHIPTALQESLFAYLEQRFLPRHHVFIAHCYAVFLRGWSLDESNPDIAERRKTLLLKALYAGYVEDVKIIAKPLIEQAGREVERSKSPLEFVIDAALRRQIFQLLWRTEPVAFFQQKGVPTVFGEELSSLSLEDKRSFYAKQIDPLIQALRESADRETNRYDLWHHVQFPLDLKREFVLRLKQTPALGSDKPIHVELIGVTSIYEKFLYSARYHYEFIDSMADVLFQSPVNTAGSREEIVEQRGEMIQRLAETDRWTEVHVLLEGQRDLYIQHKDAFTYLSTDQIRAAGDYLALHVEKGDPKRLARAGIMSFIGELTEDPAVVRALERNYLDCHWKELAEPVKYEGLMDRLAHNRDGARQNLQKRLFEEILAFNAQGKAFRTVDALTEQEEKLLVDWLLSAKDLRLLQLYVDKRMAGENPEGYTIETKMLVSYTRQGAPLDWVVLEHYFSLYRTSGREAADAYILDLKEKAKTLIGPKRPLALRQLPEYLFLVKLVFPAGNYSTHEKNLACGDQEQHIEKYTYDKAGYPVELSGLLGYELRTVEEGEKTRVLKDDKALLGTYQARIQSIQGFVSGRGPDNVALQKAFDEKVGGLFEQHVNDVFKAMPDLSPKEKMLILFLSEVLEREKSPEASPRTEILDLVVEYKYAYHENLEAYIRQSAGDAHVYSDETSQRYVLWQELSTIYGENIKHVLRHNIFEDLTENGKNYQRIVDAFGRSLALSSEGFEVADREARQIEVIYKKKFEEQGGISAETQRYEALIQKLAELYGPPEKSKSEGSKKKATFVERLRDWFPASEGVASIERISTVLKQAFPLHPRQIRRFEDTFENEQIPWEDRVVMKKGGDGELQERKQDGKYKVLLKQCLEIFGSNIVFENDEERDAFRTGIVRLLEPFEERLTKEAFFEQALKLQGLRTQARFRVNAKLGELFAADLQAINREIAKFAEKIEVEAKEERMNGPKEKIVKKSRKVRNIRSHVMKTQESANARMGAYLCIAGDEKMWQNPHYFEIVDVDEDTGKCVGLTMCLEIPAADGKKYLWMGPNPFESFLTQVSASKAFDHQYETVTKFAAENGFEGVVVPPEDGQILGACTNRGGTFPDLIKAKRLRNKKGELAIVDFGAEHTLGSSYRYNKGALIWKNS